MVASMNYDLLARTFSQNCRVALAAQVVGIWQDALGGGAIRFVYTNS